MPAALQALLHDFGACVLSGGGGEASSDVVGNVGVEKLEQTLANGSGSGNGVTCDFSHADQIAIRRGDENFFYRIEVLGTQSLLDDRKARFWRNFQKDAACDTFQAARTERRRINLSVLHSKNICRSAFGHFTALVKHHDFIETFFVCFGDGPNIVKPRDRFNAGQRGSRVSAVRTKAKPNDFAVLR